MRGRLTMRRVDRTAPARRRAARRAIVRGVAMALAASTLAACSDATAPAAPEGPGTTTLLWNARARSMVSMFGDSPPFAGRLYALLSVAQHNAIVDAADASRDQDAAARGRIERLAIATASAAILAAARPGEAANLRDSIVAARAAESATVSEVLVAEETGLRAARAVLARASHDASADPWEGTLPDEEGRWREDHGDDPLLANWGRVRPWFMTTGDQFRAPPPPAWGSAEFRAAVAEVRAISDARTETQSAIAVHWADGVFTVTPPGHWNAIAEPLLVRHVHGERETARVLALMNVAAMDATIACWDSKYAWWVPRPWQADSAITSLVGKPPHPSYPSGHSCISAAAAGVLAGLMPAERDTLAAMASEASLSRLYGGIHYRFDLVAGTEIGRAVAALALQPTARIPTTDELLAQFPVLRRAWATWRPSPPAARTGEGGR